MNRIPPSSGLFLSLLIMLQVTSCCHKDFCELSHPHKAAVRLEFDWRDAPEADPEGMRVFFYPADDDELSARRFDFPGTTGGAIDIVPGKYHVLCYNNDTEAVLFRGMDGWHSHEGFTREGSIFEPVFGTSATYGPRPKGAEEERVVISPDMMWGCSAMELEITEAGDIYTGGTHNHSRSRSADRGEVTKDEDGNQTVTLYPEELICTYTCEIHDVKNIKYVTRMCATLSGMAPSLYFGFGELGRECVTVPFGAHVDGNVIRGRFLTFGHHEENPQPHKLVLYVWFTDGSKYYYTFDVTDQIHQAPDRRHVHIYIEGLGFPQPIDNGSGFSPSIDDWTEINEDIIM